MNLQHMSVEDLAHWLSVLTAELARRAQPPPTPTQPRAPWESRDDAATWAEIAAADARAKRAHTVTAAQVAAPDINAVITAAVQAAIGGQAPAPRSFADVAAPSMLGGQQPRLPPGTVLTTRKTDPELAARFAATPPRPDLGVDDRGRVIAAPGLQGSGNGEGAIGFTND
jgi:hypothetical protein